MIPRDPAPDGIFTSAEPRRPAVLSARPKSDPGTRGRTSLTGTSFLCVPLTRTCPSLIYPKPCPAYLHLQPTSPRIPCRGATHTEERKQTKELAVTYSALTGDTDMAEAPPASSPSILTPGGHFTVPITPEKSGDAHRCAQCTGAVRTASPLTWESLALTLCVLPLVRRPRRARQRRVTEPDAALTLSSRGASA